MLVYNQSRSFQCMVEEKGGGDAARLARLVRTKGILGQKVGG
jgi:hypothetical protein